MSNVNNDPPPVARNDTQDTVQVDDLWFVAYGDQKESPYLAAIRQLIAKDLSEPYSIYVYRYFLYQWGELCFMVGGGIHRQSFLSR